MKITCTNKPVFSLSADAVVIFLFEKETDSAPAPIRKIFSDLGSKEFNGSSGQLLLIPTSHALRAKRLLLVGLGKREKFTPEILRRSMGQATKKLRGAGLTSAVVQVRGDTGTATASDAASILTDAALLAGYKFTQFKAPDTNSTKLESLIFCLPSNANLSSAKQAVSRAQVIAESTNYVREIANLPGNVVYPEVLANHARQLARRYRLKITVFNKRELQRRGFGGLLAVGGGSSREPRLITLAYRGGPKTQRPIALVGKALTFDSGGISIKPSGKMDEMKFDKCGGVTVLGILRAAAELKLPLNLIGVIGAAENMPSGSSYRPGDIVTSYRGNDKRAHTIEVLNTDAEGRVVLGDALTYAREYQPTAMIDLATLTGACVVALGNYIAGLLGNNEQLINSIRDAGNRTGDSVWPLPLTDDYRDRIKSDVADIVNTGGSGGGTITAAAFLENYVGETPWAHIDIAGTAWTTEERPYYAKGSTGFGVRLLVEALSQWHQIKLKPNSTLL